MHYKMFSAYLAISACMTFSSCDKDGDGNNNTCANWAADTQDETNAVTAAAQAYGANPTTANCNAFKDAYQSYIDAMEGHRNCAGLAGQARADWEAALNAAQTSLNNMSC